MTGIPAPLLSRQTNVRGSLAVRPQQEAHHGIMLMPESALNRATSVSPYSTRIVDEPGRDQLGVRIPEEPGVHRVLHDGLDPDRVAFLDPVRDHDLGFTDLGHHPHPFSVVSTLR
jgi:hypothetical protein